jgi:cytochrome c oxidase assembly protein subunit 11
MANSKSDKREHNPGKDGPRQHRHLTVALSMCALVVGMVGMSYAAVPLYRIFCQVTGYGGTTQRAEQAPDTILDRKIKVRFDANTGRGMGWDFRPAQRTVELKIGESALAFYEARNVTDKTITGTATFNVSPEAAGSYFSKIECFCFTEQTLEAGKTADMPVTFFIDPEMVNDPAAKNIEEITLSYTFFPVRDGKEVATAPGKKRSADGG